MIRTRTIPISILYDVLSALNIIVIKPVDILFVLISVVLCTFKAQNREAYHMKLGIIFIGMILLSATAASGQDWSLYEKEIAVSKADTLQYRILYPDNFDPKNKYPLVIFLHGRGESGNDNEKQLTHGGNLFLQQELRTKHPSIVIFPQCPNSSYWANVNISPDSSGKRVFNFVEGGAPTKAMEMLLNLTKEWKKKDFVDRDRIYVGGLSMGGMGTFELLRRERGTFAAAFAICGGDRASNVANYKKIPLWVFHGEEDKVVPIEHSDTVVRELERLGKSVRYTKYPGIGHNSWDLALAEPELLPWLFSHKR